MGALGAELECQWGLSSYMAVWPSLGKGWAMCVLRDLLPPLGQKEEEDQEGWGLPCGHMGLLWVWRPFFLPGWGWRPVWAPEPLLPGQDWESYLPLPVVSLRIMFQPHLE